MDRMTATADRMHRMKATATADRMDRITADGQDKGNGHGDGGQDEGE